MFPRCAMILQADSHDVSLVKNIIVYYARSEIICTCVRSTSVMEAGIEEQRGVVRFVTSEGVEGRGIHSSHVCCLLQTQHVTIACTGMAQVIPRWKCHCKTKPNILPTTQISPHAVFLLFEELKKCIKGHRFALNEDLYDWVKNWFCRKATSLFKNWTDRLVSQCDKFTALEITFETFYYTFWHLIPFHLAVPHI